MALDGGLGALEHQVRDNCIMGITHKGKTGKKVIDQEKYCPRGKSLSLRRIK